MEQLGILSNEQEKKLSQIVDDAIRAKGILELVDGYAAKVLISQIDDRALEKINIPEDLKTDIGLLVDAAVAEDVERAETIAANILNGLVNIPGIDEEAEGMILKGTIELILGTIISAIRK